MAAVNVYHESRLPLRVMAATTMAAATPSYGRVPCMKWNLDFERLSVFCFCILSVQRVCISSVSPPKPKLAHSRGSKLTGWLIAAVPNSRVVGEGHGRRLAI